MRRLFKDSSLGYFMVIALVFVAGTTISIIFWISTENHLNNDNKAQYQRQLEQSESIISQRLDHYAGLLSAGSGLLSVEGNNITQAEWLTFYQSYNLTMNYPGVSSVSFSQNVTSSELPGYLSSLSSHGLPNFTITPTGNRPLYAPITYIGYTSPVSLQAVGFDQLSNPVRVAAIDEARDTGKITISGMIKPLTGNKNRPSFLMYMPVYEGPSSTTAERQASIFGYVYIGLTDSTFFNTLLTQYLHPGVGIQIYDGSKVLPSALIYQTPDYAKSIKNIDANTSLLPFNYGDHEWTIKIVIAKSLISNGESQTPISRLYLGIVASAIVAGTVWYFTAYRERKITWQKQLELQRAKEDLLSLASHQLRTPATIVKQYLGILLEGYAGKLSTRQQDVIKTAYDSNERQLVIANQFLSAARLDSGRIKLRKKPINLNQLLAQTIKDQEKIIKGKTKKIIYKRPKRTFKIEADPYYLPMVFENLLSNAIKYSTDKGKINVSLKKSDKNIVVTVADNGIGIPKSELNRLFDKFTRVSNDLTADSNGSGIGLYLVKQIINLHEGEITVESEPDKGSKFIVRLPFNKLKS